MARTRSASSTWSSGAIPDLLLGLAAVDAHQHLGTAGVRHALGHEVVAHPALSAPEPLGVGHRCSRMALAMSWKVHSRSSLASVALISSGSPSPTSSEG